MEKEGNSLIWMTEPTYTLRKSESVCVYVSEFEEQKRVKMNLTKKQGNPPTRIPPRTLHQKVRHGSGDERR